MIPASMKHFRNPSNLSPHDKKALISSPMGHFWDIWDIEFSTECNGGRWLRMLRGGRGHKWAKRAIHPNPTETRQTRHQPTVVNPANRKEAGKCQKGANRPKGTASQQGARLTGRQTQGYMTASTSIGSDLTQMTHAGDAALRTSDFGLRTSA